MQDDKPAISKDLERVGVTGLRTLVVTEWCGRRYVFVPEIELTIDLREERRGAHMSRLIESITETIEEESVLRHNSLEEVEKSILMKLLEKHPYRRAQISMKTELVVAKKTPKTSKPTMETYDVEVRVLREGDVYRKILKVDVVGNTVCPHAMNRSGGETHIQRACSTLEVETDYDNVIALEDMIECVEESFPSEVYTLLKTDDEVYVVDKMFRNPKFVEDVTREVLDKARKRFKRCKIKVRTVSFESIHRHDVLAEGSAES